MPRDPLIAELEHATAPGRVLAGEMDRVAFASDASMYHLVPRAVVLAATEADIAGVLAVAQRRGVPVTFRAAGTSLSGQGVTDGILVEVARHWKGATVEADGARIRARPGMIGAHLNAILAPYGTRIGPDPSSLSACTLGGILANNSSGPCSGVAQNAYHTVESLRLVLADGTLLTTSDREAGGDADTLLRTRRPDLHAGLLELRQALLADAPLADRVRRKHATKNTMGYGLNALLDFSRPVDILAHLLVGSEGTLGFISEAVLRTIPLRPHTTTALVAYPSLTAACDAIPPLRELGVELVELLDDASLRAIADLTAIPPVALTRGAGSAALLVQLQCTEARELADREAHALAALQRNAPLAAPAFTRDAAAQARMIQARKGLYPAVGGKRRPGTSLLLEDVAFPMDRLAQGAAELQELFARHRYDDGVIFGHAKDGNLHFLVTQAVDTPGRVERYEAFLEDVAELVVGRHDGALKAEHGTGRNMAGYVEREWGPAAVDLMRRVKALFDPAGVLSPGVILPASPRAHVEDLKTVPASAPEVDRCIECGFCEPVCPSRALTLTPRQRIVVLRERARREAAGDHAGVRTLEADWNYAGLDTCATDGMCATACPVGIDTGAMVLRERHDRAGALAQRIGRLAADHFGAAVTLGRIGVALKGVAPPHPTAGPAAARAAGPVRGLYLRSCAHRLFGDTATPLLTLAARAGVRLETPPNAESYCCGLAFTSKGVGPGPSSLPLARMAISLGVGTDTVPLVVDGSSCAHAWHDSKLPTLDAVTFARRELLPHLTVTRRLPELALHIPCGARRQGIEDDLRAIAGAVAERVVEPIESGCCGFAGDRGLTHPELTASATAPMAAELRAEGCTRGASANYPCQLGMTRGTGIPFQGLLEVLEEATRPLGQGPGPR